MFAILSDFVDDEYPGRVHWDGDPELAKARDEFLSLYRWWNEERPREHQEHQRALGHETEQKGAWKSPLVRQRRKEHVERANALQAKDDEMMRRLIAVRHVLWTGGCDDVG